MGNQSRTLEEILRGTGRSLPDGQPRQRSRPQFDQGPRVTTLSGPDSSSPTAMISLRIELPRSRLDDRSQHTIRSASRSTSPPFDSNLFCFFEKNHSIFDDLHWKLDWTRVTSDLPRSLKGRPGPPKWEHHLSQEIDR